MAAYENHSRKRPAPVTDTIFASWGCPLTRALTVLVSIMSGHESVYDMKNIFCLFERPFEIQKNGVFLFEISFSVSEILSFLYYAN